MIITLIAAISADGKIGQAPGQSSLEWTSKEDTRFFVEKTKEIGTVVMGNTTFKTFGKPLKGRRLIVMTHTISPERAERVEGIEFTSESVLALVARLENEGVTHLAVCGGASVYSQFLQSGLVNELFLTVEPVLFGEGIPLVSGIGRIDLKLIESRPLGQGILMHFTIS